MVASLLPLSFQDILLGCNRMYVSDPIKGSKVLLTVATVPSSNGEKIYVTVVYVVVLVVGLGLHT